MTCGFGGGGLNCHSNHTDVNHGPDHTYTRRLRLLADA